MDAATGAIIGTGISSICALIGVGLNVRSSRHTKKAEIESAEKAARDARPDHAFENLLRTSERDQEQAARNAEQLAICQTELASSRTTFYSLQSEHYALQAKFRQAVEDNDRQLGELQDLRKKLEASRIEVEHARKGTSSG